MYFVSFSLSQTIISVSDTATFRELPCPRGVAILPDRGTLEDISWFHCSEVLCLTPSWEPFSPRSPGSSVPGEPTRLQEARSSLRMRRGKLRVRHMVERKKDYIFPASGQPAFLVGTSFRQAVSSPGPVSPGHTFHPIPPVATPSAPQNFSGIHLVSPLGTMTVFTTTAQPTANRLFPLVDTVQTLTSTKKC